MLLLVRNIGRLWRPDGVIEDAELLVADGRVARAGRRGSFRPAAEPPDAELDAAGALVTPGLVDAHSHPVYAGDRFAELAARSAGAGYAEIAAAGGGIASTVAATRRADPDRLARAVRDRLARWVSGGTTTVEAKTGYHLDRDGELAAVRLLADLDAAPGLPRVAVTFLGAHAVPPEFAGRPDDYVAEVVSWCGPAAAAGASGADVFCDEGYFTVAQSRAVLQAGRRHGLQLRVHADELARSGGSRLAAELHAVSADHLLRITVGDAAALAAASVVATLCPATALAMGVLPPAVELQQAGVTLALGSDHNPGTSGLTSMATVVTLAVHALGLSVDAALAAATAGGAAALGRTDRGSLRPGELADVVVWDTDHEGAFAWAFGELRPRAVLRGTDWLVGGPGAAAPRPVSSAAALGWFGGGEPG